MNHCIENILNFIAFTPTGFLSPRVAAEQFDCAAVFVYHTPLIFLFYFKLGIFVDMAVRQFVAPSISMLPLTFNNLIFYFII